VENGGVAAFARLRSLEEGGSANGVFITDYCHVPSGDGPSLACPVADILVKTAHVANSLTIQISLGAESRVAYFGRYRNAPPSAKKMGSVLRGLCSYR
jgi:hypothetical protein